MSHPTHRKFFLCAPLAAAALFASLDTADAASRRVAFDADYGAPFADLGWRGEAVVDDGSGDGPGMVTRLPSSCNGGLSFTSTQVAWLRFDGAKELTRVVSSPFNPIQGTIAETDYAGTPAYFSLIFVGEYAQLYWFKNNPGNALLDPLVFPCVQLPNAQTFAGCYLAGTGDNTVGKSHCGFSSNLDSAGAKLSITAVPESETYATMLAGLGPFAFDLAVFPRAAEVQDLVQPVVC